MIKVYKLTKKRVLVSQLMINRKQAVFLLISKCIYPRMCVITSNFPSTFSPNSRKQKFVLLGMQWTTEVILHATSQVVKLR